jgi:hypothetical protein
LKEGEESKKDLLSGEVVLSFIGLRENKKQREKTRNSVTRIGERE